MFLQNADCGRNYCELCISSCISRGYYYEGQPFDFPAAFSPHLASHAKQNQLIFNPDAGGKDFAAQATDGGLASIVMQSISMCDKVRQQLNAKNSSCLYSRAETVTSAAQHEGRAYFEIYLCCSGKERST